MDEKNWKKYGGIKKAPTTNNGNSMKTSNSLLLNMDFLHVCQWNKCTCLQFFWQRPENLYEMASIEYFILGKCRRRCFHFKHEGDPLSLLSILLHVFECAVRECLSIFDSCESGMLFTYSFLVLIYMCIRLHLFPHLVDLTRGSFLLEMQIPAMAGWSANSERWWK